jgi:hypothetical protein
MEIPQHPWEREREAKTVDANDLKIVWQFLKQAGSHTAPIGSGLSAVAIDPAGLQQMCSPGADVGALTYRAIMLDFLFLNVDRRPDDPETKELAKFRHDGKPDERVFQVMSSIPLGWIPKGGRQGFPFDGQEFMRQLRAA